MTQIFSGMNCRSSVLERLCFIGALFFLMRTRNGRKGRERNDNKTHCRIWNFEERKNLTRDLHKQPRNHRVGDGDLVNVAPLQLGKKAPDIYGCFSSQSF
jgi:hypothetical protein